MADKRISQLVDRGTVVNNDVIPIVVSGATTTNKATISSIQTFMQSNLDVGVTSVGITLGSSGTDVSVTGSPITSSGNITINIPTASATNRGLLSSANWTTFNNKVSSVGLSMPSAFAVANSPITGSGTIAVTGAGTVAQYIRGDGSLADFPSGGGGGGSSVNYYLNGSVSQGTIGGIAYREMNKVPILGAGTDITIAADGYIASFITDAGDPALLEIPAGNWNFESYFSASSGGGSPSFYIELYKVNSGGTATLIASNSGTPELISFGTSISPYFSPLAVPTTVLTVTDRLAVRYYVTHSGRTITLHTENSHLCQIITTFTTGLTALNGLTAQVQNFATGTSGTDFGISSSVSTHTFNLPDASASARGVVSTGSQTIAGAKTFNSSVTANSLIKTGGTSSQFLKADGSVDSSSYLTTGTASSTYLTISDAASTYVTLSTAQTITGLKTFSTSGVNMAEFTSTYATGGVIYLGRSGVSVGNIGNSGSLTVGILDDLEIRSGSSKSIHLRTDAVQFTLSPSGGTATLFSANSSTPTLVLNTTGTNQASGIITQQNGGSKWAFGSNFGSGDDSWNVYNYAAASRFLTIASTGAATFSSSVGVGNASTPTGSPTFYVQNKLGLVANIAGFNFCGTGTADNANNNLLISGGYYTGSSQIATQNAATTYQQYNGEHYFYTNTGLTAGNAYTPIERMRISSSGQVLINSQTASNDNVFKFYIDSTLASIQATYDTTGSYVPIRFLTSDTERMRITSAGDVRINFNPGAGNGLYFNDATASAAMLYFVPAIYVGTAPYNSNRIVSANNANLSFEAGGAERMKITSGGSVIVGASYMTYPVSIEAQSGGGQLALTRSGAVAEFYMGGTTGGGTVLYVRSGGSGGVYLSAGSTGWVANSDERLKTDLVPIENGLEKVASLRSVIGRYLTDEEDKKRAFLIAQDVIKVLPEAVVTIEETGDMGVNYTEVIPLLVAAIKELKTEIDSLKNQMQ